MLRPYENIKYLTGFISRHDSGEFIGDVSIELSDTAAERLMSIMLDPKSFDQSTQDLRLRCLHINRMYLLHFSKEYSTFLEKGEPAFGQRERFFGEFDVFDSKSRICGFKFPLLEFDLSDLENEQFVYDENSVWFNDIMLKMVSCPKVM